MTDGLRNVTIALKSAFSHALGVEPDRRARVAIDKLDAVLTEQLRPKEHPIANTIDRLIDR